jgi:hypothetical protein
VSVELHTQVRVTSYVIGCERLTPHPGLGDYIWSRVVSGELHAQVHVTTYGVMM